MSGLLLSATDFAWLLRESEYRHQASSGSRLEGDVAQARLRAGSTLVSTLLPGSPQNAAMSLWTPHSSIEHPLARLRLRVASGSRSHFRRFRRGAGTLACRVETPLDRLAGDTPERQEESRRQQTESLRHEVCGEVIFASALRGGHPRILCFIRCGFRSLRILPSPREATGWWLGPGRNVL
jgi:hypothetical protein